MLIRLLTNLLGAPEVARDLEKREEEGRELFYSPSEDHYWVPAATLRSAIDAEPGSLESLTLRRLASLKEWDEQYPSEWFYSTSPDDFSFMHLVRYPSIANLQFERADHKGIWISARMLERIMLHDPTMDGAAGAKPAAAEKEVDPDAGVGEDAEGNMAMSGVPGTPVEKGAEGEVTKVWIIPGCIVCDLCEELSPDVFDVQDETSVVKLDAKEDWGALSTSIIEAAVGCPVDVIKYELKASA